MKTLVVVVAVGMVALVVGMVVGTGMIVGHRIGSWMVVEGAGAAVGGDLIAEGILLIGAGEGAIAPALKGFGHGMRAGAGAGAEVGAGAGVGVIAGVGAGPEATALGRAVVEAAALVAALEDGRGVVNLNLIRKKSKVRPLLRFL